MAKKKRMASEIINEPLEIEVELEEAEHVEAVLEVEPVIEPVYIPEVVVAPPAPTELKLPYKTIKQNVTWYIKQSGKKTSYGDMQASMPWLKTFGEYKEAIDKI